MPTPPYAITIKDELTSEIEEIRQRQVALRSKKLELRARANELDARLVAHRAKRLERSS